MMHRIVGQRVSQLMALEALVFIVLLLALIALLPKFDRWTN